MQENETRPASERPMIDREMVTRQHDTKIAYDENSHLIDHLDKIGDDKKKYMLFARYMEALVAYRKFKGGKDD